MPNSSNPLPREYDTLFMGNPTGQVVFDDLIRRFKARPVFASGGAEGERQTCFNAGQHSVIDYIVTMIERANDVQMVSGTTEAKDGY